MWKNQNLNYAHDLAQGCSSDQRQIQALRHEKGMNSQIFIHVDFIYPLSEPMAWFVHPQKTQCI